MALLKAYVSNRNVAFPDVSSTTRITQSWAWLLKQMLLNATGSFDATWTDGLTHTLPAITVAGSSDGSTAGMDLVDRWLSTFTPGVLTMGAGGNAHAWIVLKFPSGICSLAGGKGPVYLCIDLDEANGASTQYLSLVVSFSGFTGGSTTNRPTATDEILPKYGGTGTIVNDGNTVPRSMHLTLAQDGTFFMVSSKNGTNHPEVGILMIETTQTRPGHTRPLFIGHDYNSSASVFAMGSGYWDQGNGYGSGSMAGWNTTGGVKLAMNAAYPYLSSIGPPMASSTWLAASDMEDGRFDDIPIPLIGMNTGQTQRTVVFPVDWAFGPYVNPSTVPFPGTPEPSTGQTEAVLIGNTFMPFSGVPTF